MPGKLGRSVNLLPRGPHDGVHVERRLGFTEASLGSRQGSPISPLLWNVVVDGLLRLLMPLGVRVQAYADDTVVLVPGKNRAQVMAAATDAIKRIETWTAGCKLGLNHDKTFCVLFSFGKGGMEKSHPTIIRLSERQQEGAPVSLLREASGRGDRKAPVFFQTRGAPAAEGGNAGHEIVHFHAPAHHHRLVDEAPPAQTGTPASGDARVTDLVAEVARLQVEGPHDHGAAHHAASRHGSLPYDEVAALQVLANQPPTGLELDRLNAEFHLFRMRRAGTFGAHTFAPDETLYPHDAWGAHRSEARGFPFVCLGVSEANARSSEPGTHVYTDISYTSASAGSAVVVLKPRGSIAAVRKFRPTIASSAYCAEVIAMAEALNYLETHQWAPPARIYADSLSLLVAMSQVTTRDARIAGIKSALHRLQRRGAVSLFHVPAHRGVFGNELADMAASPAATSGADRRSHRSFREARAAFSATVRARWAVEWRAEHSDTELYKWVPDVTNIPPDFPPHGRLACLITAHGRFTYCFHRFRISQHMRRP
ncbi:uncharacterized protein LOC142563463 [Dermacentor variabilis]|uniref:uncharacterized protein LOC142563463 n=1 Tax=Dermacentor variabilis TaxID=34621 RepID=UPI003F5AE0BF